MRRGYIRIVRGGLSEAAQRAALAAAGVNVQTEIACDKVALEPASHRHPRRDALIDSLTRGDDLVIASPGCLGSKRSDVLSTLEAVSRAGAGLVIASTGERLELPDLFASIRNFSDAASTEVRRWIARDARASRSPQTMGGRPNRFAQIRGGAIYLKIEADWRDMTLQAEAVAKTHGFSVPSLYREFGARSRAPQD